MKTVPTPATLPEAFQRRLTLDLHAPGALDELFSIHRSVFGGWKMEDETDEEREAREAEEAKAAKNDKTITQEEMSRIAAREKRDGKNSGQLELAKELGFDSVEDMKAAAKRQKDAEDKAKTDAQRREEAIAERERKAEERERVAEERERKAARKDALRDLGAKGDDLADALALLDRGLAADADEDDVTEAAEALKERRPELFGDSDDETQTDKTKRPPAAKLPTGKPGERKKPKEAEVGSAGLERARRKGWPVPE